MSVIDFPDFIGLNRGVLQTSMNSRNTTSHLEEEEEEEEHMHRTVHNTSAQRNNNKAHAMSDSDGNSDGSEGEDHPPHRPAPSEAPGDALHAETPEMVQCAFIPKKRTAGSHGRCEEVGNFLKGGTRGFCPSHCRTMVIAPLKLAAMVDPSEENIARVERAEATLRHYHEMQREARDNEHAALQASVLKEAGISREDMLFDKPLPPRKSVSNRFNRGFFQHLPSKRDRSSMDEEDEAEEQDRDNEEANGRGRSSLKRANVHGTLSRSPSSELSSESKFIAELEDYLGNARIRSPSVGGSAMSESSDAINADEMDRLGNM